MRLGLHVVPGADVAGQALWRLVEALGATAVSLAHDAASLSSLSSIDGVVVLAAFARDHEPGSTEDAGDDLGALPPRLPTAVGAFIDAFGRAGGPVLGIGAGVQLLCAMGLLPGRVTSRRAPAGTLVGASHLRIEGRPTPFTSAIPAGRVMDLAATDPVAAGMGAGPVRVGGSLFVHYQTDQPEVLEARGQVIFRYCDASGRTCDAAGGATPATTWDRSPHSIAGVCGPGGNVVGLLSDPGAVAGDGHPLLRSLSMHLRPAR